MKMLRFKHILILIAIIAVLYLTIRYLRKIIKTPKQVLIFLGVLFALSLFATLPFHYILSKGKVFPKDNLTFTYTFINENDVNQLLERYNDASIIERNSIRNEPLFRKLVQIGILIQKNKVENQEDNK